MSTRSAADLQAGTQLLALDKPGTKKATSRVVMFQENTTYYWQRKTYTDTEADDGAWWSVTVTGPPLFTTTAPGHRVGGLWRPW